MQVKAFKCDAEGCDKSRLDEDEMITATVTIKGTTSEPRHQFKVHACNVNHLVLAVIRFAMA